MKSLFFYMNFFLFYKVIVIIIEVIALYLLLDIFSLV